MEALYVKPSFLNKLVYYCTYTPLSFAVITLKLLQLVIYDAGQRKAVSPWLLLASGYMRVEVVERTGYVLAVTRTQVTMYDWFAGCD